MNENEPFGSLFIRNAWVYFWINFDKVRSSLKTSFRLPFYKSPIVVENSNKSLMHGSFNFFVYFQHYFSVKNQGMTKMKSKMSRRHFLNKKCLRYSFEQPFFPPFNFSHVLGRWKLRWLNRFITTCGVILSTGLTRLTDGMRKWGNQW